MPKIRKPKTIIEPKNSPTDAEIEFISNSHDGNNIKEEKENPIIKDAQSLNKNAKRDYNAIRIPFNEYEYKQLQIGAELTGRSKLNFIRNAILNYTKNEQEKH